MTFQRAIENDETWKSDVLETPDTLHGTGLSTPSHTCPDAWGFAQRSGGVLQGMVWTV